MGCMNFCFYDDEDPNDPRNAKKRAKNGLPPLGSTEPSPSGLPGSEDPSLGGPPSMGEMPLPPMDEPNANPGSIGGGGGMGNQSGFPGSMNINIGAGAASSGAVAAPAPTPVPGAMPGMSTALVPQQNAPMMQYATMPAMPQMIPYPTMPGMMPGMLPMMTYPYGMPPQPAPAVPQQRSLVVHREGGFAII